MGWVNVETEEEQAELSAETPLEAKLHAKRSSARRAGSTSAAPRQREHDSHSHDREQVGRYRYSQGLLTR